MERCLFGRADIYLPNLLTEDLDVFLEVVGVNTWQNVLSENQRHNLMTLLPSFEQNDGHEKIQTLQRMFNGENFKFGNPLQMFHKSLREGRFSPEIARYTKMIKKAKYKDYLNRQKLYVSKLLKEVLVNRQRFLDAVSQMPPGESLKMEWWRMADGEKPKANKCLELTVCKKYKTAIKEINEECGQVETSSDEEDLLTECSRNPAYASALLQVDDFTPSVFGTLDMKPKMANGGGAVRPGKRSVSPVTMNEEAYFSMLRKHKKRRTDAYDDPELKIEGTTLEDVMARTYGKPVGKKPRGPYKKRAKKPKLEGSMPALWQPGMSLDDNAMDAATMATDVKDEQEEDVDVTQMYVNKQIYGQHGSFFCVLREFIGEEQDSKISTFKIEQKVCDWQKSQCAKMNAWFTSQDSWSDVTLSALRFLAGHIVGLEMCDANFVPFVDYKERAQLWKWIGEGRDTDVKMQPLCEQWLQHVKLEGPGDQREGMATPPPRSTTDYIVKPADDEDKEVFQEQETLRFENPHQAFTYYMHGYESVVGPVKGVYDKPESANPKARDHTLLVKERPPFVTILTLVRDAAARLPNGSGTRADICELLKYSQYLADDSADSLINSVVSGALDRLQYEKDPCVKYSSSRKIWIYLHRQRSEEDFNKIHQTHGKAAKAKQALAKPKALKKSKEVLTQSLLGTPPSSLPGTILSSSQNSQIFYPGSNAQPPQSLTRIPATKIVQVSSCASSMSGLDILSSVAQSKIGGAGRGGGEAAATTQKVVSSSEAGVSPSIHGGRVVKRIIPTASGPRMVSIARPLSADTAAPASSLLASHLMGSGSASASQLIGTAGGSVSAQQTILKSKSPVAVASTGSATSKPVAFSLLQSNTVSKLLESHAGGANIQRQQQTIQSNVKTKTVVVGPHKGSASPTVSAGAQSMIATLKQGGGTIGQTGAQVTKTLVLEKKSHPATGQITASQTLAAASRNVTMPTSHHVISAGGQVITVGGGTGNTSNTGSHVISHSGASATPVSKPVLARLIQQTSKGGVGASGVGGGAGQQVITLSGGQKAVVSSAMRVPSSIVTMAGTSLTQTIVQSGSRQAKPLILQRVSSGGLSPVVSTRTIPSNAATSATIQTTAVKPETIVVTKADSSPSASSQRTAAHNIIQVPSMGKTATLGGKPIIIGGKPMTISTVGGKPVAIASGKPVAISQGKPLQMGGNVVTVAKQSPIQVGRGKPIQFAGQTMQIGGKPVQISGAGANPVQISGKPVQISGKPVQIAAGKPVQISGQSVQVRGQPVQIGGKPVQISGGKPAVQMIGGKAVQIGAKPVQVGGKPMQIGGKPVQISMVQQQQSPQGGQTPSKQVTVVASSANQSPGRSVAMPGGQAVTLSQSVVNQLIQSGQLKAQPGTTVKAVSGSALQQVLSGGTIAGQQVKVQTQPVSQPGVKTVTLSSATSGGSGPKIVTVSQSGMQQSQQRVLGTGGAGTQRIILQSSQGGTQQIVSGGSKQIIQPTSGGATVAGVRAGQNIQLVRSVVSPQSGKPGGATTIMVAPQGSKGATPTLSNIVNPSNVQTIVASSPQSMVGTTKVVRGPVTGQTPVYARIVSPSASGAGIRLASPQATTGATKIVQGAPGGGQMRGVTNIVQQSGGAIRTIQGVNLVQTAVRSPNANVGAQERTDGGGQ